MGCRASRKICRLHLLLSNLTGLLTGKRQEAADIITYALRRKASFIWQRSTTSTPSRSSSSTTSTTQQVNGGGGGGTYCESICSSCALPFETMCSSTSWGETGSGPTDQKTVQSIDIKLSKQRKHTKTHTKTKLLLFQHFLLCLSTGMVSRLKYIVSNKAQPPSTAGLDYGQSRCSYILFYQAPPVADSSTFLCEQFVIS